MSNGLVLDHPIRGEKPWTLGDYVEDFGGVTTRGKKSFGILLNTDEEGKVRTSVKGNICMCMIHCICI